MHIFSLVDDYIKEKTAQEDEVLSNVIRSLDSSFMPQHSISATQGKFLQVMATVCNARRILELGTLGGYSTIWLARALPHDGHLISIEFDSKHAEVARKNIEAAGLQHMVTIRTGKALDEMNKMIEENSPPFDLIFIDADKPPYREYFEMALQLARKGTIIICDNVIREGKVLDDHSEDEKVKGVQLLNDQLGKDNRVIATILQTVGAKEHDGMAIAVVK